MQHTLQVLQQQHASQVPWDWTKHGTLKQVARNFMWDRLLEDVANHVLACINCTNSEADGHSSEIKLVLIPTGEQAFTEIANNFLGKVSESEGFNRILIVTDTFTKVQYYHAGTTISTATHDANACLSQIWRLPRLSRYIIFDRGLQFTYNFYKELNRMLQINVRRSTAYHSETDRLSKRAVQTRKQFLCIYCHNCQTHCRVWAPLTEFAYTTISATTYCYSLCWNLYDFASGNMDLDNNY